MKNRETGDEENNRWHPWLKPMLGVSFYEKCMLHSKCPKFGCNRFCLDCMDGALCPISVQKQHQGHRIFQIRKSGTHDVIKVSDIQEILDLKGIKKGIINHGKVVFLRKHTKRPAKLSTSESDFTSKCEACWGSILEKYRFCSLSCWMLGIPKNFQTKKRHLEDIYSGSSPGREKSKVQGFTPLTPSPALVNYRTKRRKGIPHRAPMG